MLKKKERQFISTILSINKTRAKTDFVIFCFWGSTPLFLWQNLYKGELKDEK
jgi:hypothetical protein